MFGSDRKSQGWVAAARPKSHFNIIMDGIGTALETLEVTSDSTLHVADRSVVAKLHQAAPPTVQTSHTTTDSHGAGFEPASLRSLDNRLYHMSTPVVPSSVLLGYNTAADWLAQTEPNCWDCGPSVGCVEIRNFTALLKPL